MFRGDISKWLMHDDQKELFEILVASAMNNAIFATQPIMIRLDFACQNRSERLPAHAY